MCTAYPCGYPYAHAHRLCLQELSSEKYLIAVSFAIVTTARGQVRRGVNAEGLDADLRRRLDSNPDPEMLRFRTILSRNRASGMQWPVIVVLHGPIVSMHESSQSPRVNTRFVAASWRERVHLCFVFCVTCVGLQRVASAHRVG